MEIFSVIAQQLALLVIYLASGAILIKTKVLTSVTVETLSRFVMKFALPVMLFINTVNGVDRKTLFDSLSILALALLFYILVYFLGLLLTKVFHLHGSRSNVYRALTMFGNIGFMGTPIINGIYGNMGMLYISLFSIIDQFALWSIGVKLTLSEAGRFNFKKIINPPTVAITAALVFGLADIRLPGLLDTALTRIGSTATPLSMIYLGAVFAGLNIRKYINKIELYAIVVIKMVIFPILFFMLISLFPIPQDIRLTMTIMAALPSMPTVVMMAKSSGSEGDYALGAMFVTTLCSVVVIPAVSLIIGKLPL